MTMTTAAFSSCEAIGSRQGNRSMWRHWVSLVIDAPTPTAQSEISGYLARHSHDLPPQVFIELERRRFGP